MFEKYYNDSIALKPAFHCPMDWGSEGSGENSDVKLLRGITCVGCKIIIRDEQW